MTPQEKLDWFWVFGQVPGNMFVESSSRKPKEPGQPRRRQARRLQDWVHGDYTKSERPKMYRLSSRSQAASQHNQP
jgi:hypothetical protein